MPLPPFIICPDSEGDENRYEWSTRIPQSSHQFLTDLKNDYEMSSKSQALRACIFFTQQHFRKVVEDSGSVIGKQISAALEVFQVRAEQDKRREIHKQILELLARAAGETGAPMRIRLENAAKNLAGVWSITFPPPDLPLMLKDKNAAYVLRKLRQIASEQQTNRVRLNDLNPRARSFKASDLREILLTLERADYLELTEEKTSGPPTLWITLPTLESSGIFNR